MEERGGGCAIVQVFWFGYIPSSIREAVSNAGIHRGVAAIPGPKPMELSYQVLQLLIFILEGAVLEADCLGFDLLCGAVRCFIFRVKVVRGSRAAAILLSVLIVRDFACPIML